MFDEVWIHARIATMVQGGGPYGLIENGALAVQNGRIAWVGPMAELPGNPPASRVSDAGRRVITPRSGRFAYPYRYVGEGLVDFEVLARGGTRQELIQAGGGVRGLSGKLKSH